MAENANNTTGTTPRNQCFLAAAKKNRLLRISAHLLNFISLSFFIVGTGLKGVKGELLIAAAVAVWFIACHLFDASGELGHG